MAKTITPPNLAAAVVWDSNSLFSESETELIGGSATKDLGEILRTEGIEIIVPRVVAGELLFRKDWALANLRNDAVRKLTSIGGLISCPQPILGDHSILRIRLQRRFISWCRTNRIRLWRIPFAEVNWRLIASSAITRRPPFSPFDPKGKSEKGFRDALILETLTDVHRSVIPKPVVFICADELLAQTAVAMIGDERLSVYKTSSEYLSYLKLQRQKFAKEAIAAIIAEATAVFYSPGSKNCVYERFDIPEKLHVVWLQSLRNCLLSRLFF